MLYHFVDREVCALKVRIILLESVYHTSHVSMHRDLDPVKFNVSLTTHSPKKTEGRKLRFEK